ncbi:MAG: hypothetical protein AAB093_07120, partial [Nitrospirota bacterium]
MAMLQQASEMRPAYGESGRMSLDRVVRIPLLILTLLLPVWSSTPVHASDAREFILDNGMKVLLVEAPKAPV